MYETPRTGKSQLILYWQGDSECTKNFLKGGEIKVIDIFFDGVSTKISGSLPRQGDLTSKVVQLKINTREDTGNSILDTMGEKTVDSISYPPEVAKTIKIQARTFFTYVDRSIGTMDRNGRISFNNYRATREDLTVSIKEKPDFKEGECYGIYVEHTVRDDDDKIEARIRLENSIEKTETHFSNLMEEIVQLLLKKLPEAQSKGVDVTTKEATADLLISTLQELASQWLEKFSSADFMRMRVEANDYQCPFNRILIYSSLLEVVSNYATIKSHMENMEPIIAAFDKGGFEEAMRMAETFEDEGRKYFAFGALVNTCINLGWLEKAKIAFAKIPDGTAGKEELLKDHPELRSSTYKPEEEEEEEKVVETQPEIAQRPPSPSKVVESKKFSSDARGDVYKDSKKKQPDKKCLVS